MGSRGAGLPGGPMNPSQIVKGFGWTPVFGRPYAYGSNKGAQPIVGWRKSLLRNGCYVPVTVYRNVEQMATILVTRIVDKEMSDEVRQEAEK
ncbi:MAG: hypothetical protein COV10_00450 [Candidatus Vogelbacteria bacterium CG10_big_fil_rev_8_21_14_0_10_51_16]|uniref:Uncharacterized protein n=1 Tax=Candidatus Vogelbacteria bacterium CG10_big_fil_rev_8_21_14_0_10_51_16 TaxID=1975045 RepID=A0A2H0RFH3_9BACT|nr:MAG: hypothetical protein COV10_00450 [Candidatus Vogelbacteria bacterium CG10_big_fil_rev_8_21_14_0_10_51_16]